MLQRLPVVTYTFLNDLENCARKAHHKHVLKDIKKESSPQLEWGSKVHDAMDERITNGVPLPADMKAAEPVVKTLDELKQSFKVKAELMLGVRIDGSPCDFFDNAVWARGKADVAVVDPPHAWIVDWKTGKVREEPFELEVHALLLMQNDPRITHVLGQFFWMQDSRIGKCYDITNLDPVKGKIANLYAKAQHYNQSGVWPPRKNPLCPWCPVKSCEYNSSSR